MPACARLQARDGSQVSGQLDDATRLQLLPGLALTRAVAMAGKRVGVLSHEVGDAERLLEGTASLTAKPVDVPIEVPSGRRSAV